jgi:hypothetical protein
MLSVRLDDLTAPANLFNSVQESLATAAESFTVGGSGGDSSNVNTGLATGTLIGGRNYRLIVQNVIHAQSSAATQAATGSGTITLTFVPEPSTALLLGAGLAALAAARRRTRH